MSMLFVSKKLLRKELDERPIDMVSDEQKLYYSLIEKELHLLERLNITICDMTGNIDEVAERLKNSEILICSHEESADMQMAVQFKRDIMGVVGNYNALWDRVCG